jgi:cytochrome c-type protein NapB
MMKTKILTAMAVAGLALGACALALGPPIDDRELGLSKGSVYDVLSPAVFSYPTTEPDESQNLPRAFEGAPPLVPHEVAGLPPITVKRNECLDCHNKPLLIGKNKKGISPMSESHYVKLAGKMKPRGALYVCDQCHVPQADVKPLVDNTFVQKKKP